MPQLEISEMHILAERRGLGSHSGQKTQGRMRNIKSTHQFPHFIKKGISLGNNKEKWKIQLQWVFLN
jgi:hypothetical protein